MMHSHTIITISKATLFFSAKEMLWHSDNLKSPINSPFSSRRSHRDLSLPLRFSLVLLNCEQLPIMSSNYLPIPISNKWWSLQLLLRKWVVQLHSHFFLVSVAMKVDSKSQSLHFCLWGQTRSYEREILTVKATGPFRSLVLYGSFVWVRMKKREHMFWELVFYYKL